MIYTPLTNRAMRLAYAAHQGQWDKCGQPYIFHSYHLAEQMDDEISVCVALLHDVAEDTDISLDQLEREFPREVTDALRLLTHEKGTDYFPYIQALRANPVARKVKLADIAHNADETRYAGCGEVDGQALLYRRQKYAKARAMLENVPHLSLTWRRDGRKLPIDVLPAVVGRRSAGARPEDEGDIRYEIANCHAISRSHVRFIMDGGRIFVEDLNSTNGTFINGERIAPFRWARLADGDCLSLGIEEFAVSITGPDA